MTEFEKFAIGTGLSSNTLNDYKKATNGIVSPTIIEERQLNVATMDIFSRLMYDRIIVLGTAIDDEVANIVTCQLMYLNSIDKESEIKLFINSPGGSVVDGLAIYDIMNWVEPDVSTYCMGMAASMGSILLSSGTKGKRYSLPNSRIMIHQASTYLGWAQTSDAKINYDETKFLQDNLYRILSENTGKSFEEIEKDADRDKWFSPNDAIEYGIIDKIISKKI
jgi:ATP-dependent Clp protease protease subunit